MTTFENIIQEVFMNLESYLGNQDVYGTLHANISATATSFVIDGAVFADGSGFSEGMLEVGEELMYVQSFDRTTATASGVLRGWRGTTATTHVANSLIRNNPRFPRNVIKRAINDALTNLHPRVPVIKSTEFNFLGGVMRYDLPAEALDIVSVSYSVPGATKSWQTSQLWSFDQTGGSTSVTGKTIELRDALPGRKVQVVYQAETAELVNSADDFTAVTGLPSWVRDLVVYGACFRIASFLDSSKASSVSAEQSFNNIKGAYGSASATSGQTLAKYFLGLYNVRLEEAEKRILRQYPTSVHYI